MLSVARLTSKELLLDDFGLPDASSSEVGRRHVIACEWYSVYVGCWAPCLRIEPTAHSLFIFLSMSCLPRTTSSFLCCIPKPKELWLPTSVKAPLNDPFGLLGGHEIGDRCPTIRAISYRCGQRRCLGFWMRKVKDARGVLSPMLRSIKAFIRSSWTTAR